MQKSKKSRKKIAPAYGPRGVSFYKTGTGNFSTSPVGKVVTGVEKAYAGATKGIQNYGRNLGRNIARNQQDFKSGNMPYYGTKNPFPNPFSAKSYQKTKAKHKKKAKMGVDNKMKGSYGETIIRKGKPPVIKINVKKHKGNRAELADTIKHELMHAKHPKMHEKTVYKKTGKIGYAEQEKLISKLRSKKLNYKTGAAKRKFKMGRVSTKPGDLISKMNDAKRTAIMGLI